MQKLKISRAQNRVKLGGSTENVILGRVHDDIACMAIQFSDEMDGQCKRKKRTGLEIV